MPTTAKNVIASIIHEALFCFKFIKHNAMAEYYRRKSGALAHVAVLRRGDPGLTGWWPDDKWNAPFWAGQPQFVPNVGAKAANPYGGAVNQRSYVEGNYPRADREFGLHTVGLYERVLERAPDSNKGVISNMDQLGFVIRGYLNK